MFKKTKFSYSPFIIGRFSRKVKAFGETFVKRKIGVKIDKRQAVCYNKMNMFF